ncbi:MAG: cytochrome c biogenesis protein CcsA [Polyangiaceae bacterium]|nr:cytochrome c biogenesis protein CcsA [Polyangiaceae bacterium]
MAMNEPAASRTTNGGRSTSTTDMAFYALVLLAAIAFAVTIHVIFYRVPVEATMGIVQKIFYFHVPAAISMYLGAIACFIGSAGYLARGTRNWDALARSGAEAAVVMGMMVLVTGPLWAAKAWGVYWTWDPRLTTSMLQVLIYISYVVLRSFAGDGDAERKFAAALGVLGAANLPIIRYSVQKWGGNHPTVISSGGGGLGHPDMKLALYLGFATFALLTVLLIWSRYRLEVAKNRLQEIEEEALELGLGEE